MLIGIAIFIIAIVSSIFLSPARLKAYSTRNRLRQLSLSNYSKTLGLFDKWLFKEIALYQAINLGVSRKDIISVYAICLCIGLSLGAIGLNSWLLGTVLACFCMLIPRTIIFFISLQRRNNFEKVFPDGLSLIANSLRSGFSLEHCFQLIEKDMPPPLSEEFAVINKDLRLGSSLATTLREFSKRITIPQVRLFVTAVIIQQEVGGSLADIMNSLAYTIRKEKEIYRELRVLTAQGRSTAILVGILPFALLALINSFSPEYTLPLFTTSSGHLLIAAALLLEIVGMLTIKKIMDIK